MCEFVILLLFFILFVIFCLSLCALLWFFLFFFRSALSLSFPFGSGRIAPTGLDIYSWGIKSQEWQMGEEFLEGIEVTRRRSCGSVFQGTLTYGSFRVSSAKKKKD